MSGESAGIFLTVARVQAGVERGEFEALGKADCYASLSLPILQPEDLQVNAGGSLQQAYHRRKIPQAHEQEHDQEHTSGTDHE
jgi:hypothetical protein